MLPDPRGKETKHKHHKPYHNNSSKTNVTEKTTIVNMDVNIDDYIVHITQYEVRINLRWVSDNMKPKLMKLAAEILTSQRFTSLGK